MTDAVGAAQQPCESPKPCRYCGAAVRWLPKLSAAMWPFEAPVPAELVAAGDAYGVKRLGGVLTAVPLAGRRAPGGRVLRRHDCAERRHHIPGMAAA